VEAETGKYLARFLKELSLGSSVARAIILYSECKHFTMHQNRAFQRPKISPLMTPMMRARDVQAPTLGVRIYCYSGHKLAKFVPSRTIGRLIP
jgi:hypothetical protein